MATIEQIRKILDTHYAPRFNRQTIAFEKLLMDRCEDRTTEEFIHRMIDEAIEKGELPFGQVWTQAWRGFYAETGPMILQCEANEELLLKALAKRGHPLTAENLLGLGNNRELVAKLAKTQEWHSRQNQVRRDQEAWKQEGIAASNESIEAAELESELLASWYDANGKLRWDADPRAFASAQARVKGLSLEQLRAEVATRNEKKRLRNLPKEELRAVLKSDEKTRKESLLQKPEVPSASPIEISVPLGKIRIPSLYFPPGKHEGLPWSIRLYELLPATERQRLIRTFGSDQIVAACRAAKAAQGAK